MILPLYLRNNYLRFLFLQLQFDKTYTVVNRGFTLVINNTKIFQKFKNMINSKYAIKPLQYDFQTFQIEFKTN